MARHFSDVMLGSIELFCLAAELESFTLAANEAGLTPAAVSRAIARLEERLQVQLFVRSTRKIRLTEAGRSYFNHCRQALTQINDAERELGGAQAEPSGRVRISVPTTLGHYLVLPALADFRARHPRVQIEVQVSNRNVDFTQEDFDFSIRARAPADSGLVAQRLIDAELVVVASAEYVRQRGAPGTTTELNEHECIQFLLPSTGLAAPWRFRAEGKELEIATKGSVTYSDDFLGGATLARHGAGLLQTYRFIVEEDIKRGTMVELLQEFGGCSRPFSLIYPGSRYMPLRVRLLMDFLKERIAKGANL